LDGERAGFTRAIEQPIDDSKVRSERLKLGRQRQSSRTGADDQHIERRVTVHHFLRPPLSRVYGRSATVSPLRAFGSALPQA
jgi:hypothetical protein